MSMMSISVLFRRVFSLDLRSIALFRVMLATILLTDLALRSFHMRTFYTDLGVLPREHWLELSHRWHWSLHTANGELWWQILLFTAAALFAFALLVGYRTRLAAFASFVLLASLLNRNGLVLQGGDQLLVIMSFWSLFLPLAARFSVDSALQPSHRLQPNPVKGDGQTDKDSAAASGARPAVNSSDESHTAPFATDSPWFSVATVAIVFQVLYLYFFTAIMKTGDAWTVRFDAAYYAVSLQHFATPIGLWMTQFPGLLKLATGFVLGVEYFGPLLVLCPFFWPWLRLGGLLLLGSLHLAFLLMLHIGLFPFIDFMALSLLIPGAVWVKAQQSSRHQHHLESLQAIRFYYDEDCGFCLKMCLVLRTFLLPDSAKILPAQQFPTIYPVMERENSWVVTDADGKQYIHWHAMAFLFSQRWPVKPLGWLMKLAPLMWLGNTVYRWVAENRGFMSQLTERFLPYRAMPAKPGMLGSLVALLFFYVVTSFNVHGLPQVAAAMPYHVDKIARITRLDQRWDMFAPFPLTLSSYWLVPGQLRNGEQVDLHELTSSRPDWQPSERYYPLYDGYRWRKYLGRVDGHHNNTVRSALGSYYCRVWNEQPRDRETQLATLEIHTVKVQTNTDGLPKSISSRRVWRHWCFAEFAD